MLQAEQPPKTAYETGDMYKFLKPQTFLEQRIDSAYYDKFPSLKKPLDLKDLTKEFSLAGKSKKHNFSVLMDLRSDVGEFWAPGYRDDFQVLTRMDENAINTEYFHGSDGTKISTASLLKVAKGLYLNPKVLYDTDQGKFDGKELRLMAEINKNLKLSGGYFDYDRKTEGNEGYFLVAQGKGNYKKLDFGGGIEALDKNENRKIDPKLGAYGWAGAGDYLLGLLADGEENRMVLGDYKGDFGFRLHGVKNKNGFQKLQLIVAKNPDLRFERDFLNPLRNETMREQYGTLGFGNNYHPWRYKCYFPSQVAKKGALLYAEYKKLPDEKKQLAGGGLIRLGGIHFLDIALRSDISKKGKSENRFALGWETDFERGPLKGWGIFLEGLYNIEKRKIDDVFIYLAKKFEF